ncbi:MAG: VWA domain-containing protein [Polyangiaceae bacterium]|nr:VWA domain-containing protein [Myxococcales bacterium]MCB9585547.1 VWA domain-containing protein [Polyangiaceae bacterium]MCB9606437.1 VWA domain-containing protein [Polyangiaceae bacterium]
MNQGLYRRNHQLRWARRVVRSGMSVLALALLGAAASCSASDTSGGSGGGAGSGGAGNGGSSAFGGSGGDGGLGATDAGGGTGGLDPDASCGRFTAAAEQIPAAMLVVLDRSRSMTTNSKWPTAQQAIVQAIDNDAFDDLSLGLLAYPSSTVAGPACLFNLPVACGVSALPQVPIGPTAKNKSNSGTGSRAAIYQWLVNNNPDNGAADASPGYEALRVGINSLRQLAINGKRILIYITDGGFGCASVSARGGYTDANGCLDWEYPDSVNTLITAGRTDATAPVDTFIVGVPGSNTNGGSSGGIDAAPYSMRLALSSYAYSGAPDYVPSDCDGRTFTQGGADPTVPCHFDMTQGNFSINELAKAISDIRGRALGCTFSLPEPPAGETIDPGEVNVNVTVNGNAASVPRRADSSDTCETDGCWDYNAEGDVELLGKACSDLEGSTSSQVDILVGCKTVIK